MTVFGMTDYVYKTTGEQLNGTISAIGGFSYKCGTAISNAILAGVLAATGYIANAIGQEPEAVLIGINSVRFLVPLAFSSSSIRRKRCRNLLRIVRKLTKTINQIKNVFLENFIYKIP